MSPTLHNYESLEVTEHSNLLIQQMFIKTLLCAVVMQREVYSPLPWEKKQSLEKKRGANKVYWTKIALVKM